MGNGNETVTHTINGDFEQKLLSNHSIPVFPPEMNPEIYQGISPIVLAPQTILVPPKKEADVDAESGGAWITGICGN